MIYPGLVGLPPCGDRAASELTSGAYHCPSRVAGLTGRLGFPPLAKIAAYRILKLIIHPVTMTILSETCMQSCKQHIFSSPLRGIWMLHSGPAENGAQEDTLAGVCGERSSLQKDVGWRGSRVCCQRWRRASGLSDGCRASPRSDPMPSHIPVLLHDARWWLVQK